MKKKIIVIGHMPCTAGTFYTHFIGKIISSDTPLILPETNPFNTLLLRKKAFMPYSINVSSYINNFSNFDEYLFEYKKELINFVEKWQSEHSNNLIIRDHIWSQYSTYKSHSLREPIISKLLKDEAIDYIPIFTKRDPIDSFLSLSSNFPHIEINVKEYKNIYFEAINAWRLFHKNKLIEINIEDFVKNKQKIKTIFKKKFDNSFTYDFEGLKLNISELSSGASGRGNNYPTILKRKPFSFLFWREILKNKDFLEFRKNIGYGEKFKFTGPLNLILSFVHLIYQPLLTLKIGNKRVKSIFKSKFLAYR